MSALEVIGAIALAVDVVVALAWTAGYIGFWVVVAEGEDDRQA